MTLFIERTDIFTQLWNDNFITLKMVNYSGPCLLKIPLLKMKSRGAVRCARIHTPQES